MALLSAFNPHDMSERTVRTVATGRDDALREILAAVRSNLRAPTMQHLIVSAPRGYGKSFLMRHLQLEVTRTAREEDLPLAVVLMPEEMPHVKEPETLVRELTRALTGGAASEAELTWHEDDGAAWDGAVAELRTAIRARVGPDGLVVALVENFDVLLRRAFPKEVQASRLRALLSDRGSRLMVVAASATGAFDRDYDGRLFQAFHEVALEPWSIEDCMAFFDRQRVEAGEAPLDDAARARARAVASFIGGTPRLATLLGDALFDDDVLRAADLLQKLVDELTPYYKERIEALPGRSQKLLDALLRGGEPATPSEVARRVQARSQAAIAGPFSELARERIVVGERAPGSAEVLYRVADRVFAHYYRRRILDHGAPSCPLEALVDLLAHFFTPEEKRGKAEEFARLGRMPEARLMARLARMDLGAGPANRWPVHNLERYILCWLVPLASSALAGDLLGIADAALCGALDRASTLVDWRLNGATPSDRTILLLIRAGLDHCEEIRSNLVAAEQALASSKEVDDPVLRLEALLFWIWHLGHAGQYEAAIAQAVDAEAEAARLSREDYQGRAVRHMASGLLRLRRHDEGVLTARRAAGLARASGDVTAEAVCLRHAAFGLGQLERHDEALALARQAADLARAAGDRREEAICLRYAAFGLSCLKHHGEAVAIARQAADLACAAGDVRGQSESLRHAAFNLGRLRQHDEAVNTARQAADLARAAGNAGEEAACLYYAAFSLDELERHDEAVTTAREAVMLARDADSTWVKKRALLLISWSLGELGCYAEALNAIAEAARLLDEAPEEEDDQTLTIYTGRVARLAVASLTAAPNLDAFHALLEAAALALSGNGPQARCLASFLEVSSESAILDVGSAEALDAWAAAIDLRFPERFAAEVGRMRAAAQYHASGRSRAVLARLDPDFAQTLETFFPMADEARPKSPKAGVRRKR